MPEYATTHAFAARSLPCRVLANVFPKNGTHLLLKALGLVPGLSDSGRAVDWGDPEEALRRVAETRPGEITKGHIPCVGAAPDFVAAQGMTLFTMIRDPRDTVVSFYHYVLRHPEHYLHASYARMRTNDERLMATIAGFHDSESASLNDIGWRLRNWTGWLEKPYCCTVYFERLIGPAGGGDRARQEAEIHKILGHLRVEATPGLVTHIADRVFDPHVHSFRQGLIGDWRNHFNADHRAAFKRVANWALLLYGYESAEDW